MKEVTTPDTHVHEKIVALAYANANDSLVKILLHQIEDILDGKINKTITDLATYLEGYLKNTRELFQICEINTVPDIGSSLFQELEQLLISVHDISICQSSKGKYVHQRYTRDRIVVDHDTRIITILPEQRTLPPYNASKERYMNDSDRQFFTDLFDKHAENTYLTSTLSGRTHQVPYERWETKITQDEFNKLLSIVGACKDLLVEPRTIDFGFNFGINIVLTKKNKKVEHIIAISEKSFPEEYTGKHVYDELVCNTINLDQLRTILRIQPKHYESYLY